MDKYLNADGKTYNGVAMLADISGLDRAEIAWMAQRIKGLFAEGKTRREAYEIVIVELKSKPWLQTPGA